MIVAGVLVSAVLGAAPLEVHTATRDVRDCLAIGHGGGYLAATDGGVVFVDDDGVAGAPLTVFDGLPETRALVLEPVVGARDAWWIGTEGGLARLERRGAELRVIASWDAAPVRAIVEHDGRVLVGSWGDGVLELRGDELVSLPGPALANADRVTALVVDGDAVLAGSAGAGAWVVGPKPEALVGVEGVVWSLAVHEGSVYAGTLAGVRKLAGERSITVSTADARALASVGGGSAAAARGSSRSLPRRPRRRR